MNLFKAIKDTKRVFGFLSGLHKDFDGVRSRILGTKPLRAMNIVFSEVRQEESRLKVMMGSNSNSTMSSESSAPMTHTKSSDKGKDVFFASKKPRSSVYQKKYCKYYHRVGHVVDECYRRIGSKVKPPPFYKPTYHSNQTFSGRSDLSGSWRTDADS